MRICSFLKDGSASYGLVTEDGLFEVGTDLRRRCPSVKALLSAGRVSELAESLEPEPLEGSAIEYLPPIVDPDKILCVGVNYLPHVVEMGREPPKKPVVFVRFPNSLVGHKAALKKPSLSEQYDYEGELAVIIGKRCRHVSEDDAMTVIAGYCAFMDGSVRDWQRHTHQFTPGKNFTKSGAAGPWLVTTDEVPDIESVPVATAINGEQRQDGRISDLIFGIPALISYCSSFAELVPGDMIVTGTPGGVGAAMDPPCWLKGGDTVEVDLGPVGRLQNPVIDESE